MEKFVFGKYRGQDISLIIKKHPSYVLWALKNVTHFLLTPKQYNALYESIYSDESQLKEISWDSECNRNDSPVIYEVNTDDYFNTNY